MPSGWHYSIGGADRECNHKVGMNAWLARIATIISDRKSGQRGSLGLRQQTSLSTVRLSCRLVPFQLHSCLLHLLVQACRQRPPAWRSHRIFDYLLDSARSCLAPTRSFIPASSKRMICMPSDRFNDASPSYSSLRNQTLRFFDRHRPNLCQSSTSVKIISPVLAGRACFPYYPDFVIIPGIVTLSRYPLPINSYLASLSGNSATLQAGK